MKNITEDVVKMALADPEWVVVDARPSGEFAGWALTCPVEGHIPGSTDFSADWLRYPDAGKPSYLAHMRDLLDSKGIRSANNIILCDHNGRDAEMVSAFFHAEGIEAGFYFRLDDWTGGFVTYPGFKRSVPIQWVMELISGGSPKYFRGGKYQILEVSWGKPTKEFIEHHIPGSTHVDTEEYEMGDEWIRPSDEELERFARRNGITADSTVICYCTKGEGAIYKLASMLEFMGVECVLTMNGSLQNWIMAGYPTESGLPEPTPVESFGRTIPARPWVYVDMEGMKKVIEPGNTRDEGIDVRTWGAYIGVDTEYSYVPIAGRIPNTKWCFNKYHYMSPNDTMGNAEEVVAYWQKCGVDLGKHNVFFCGSGAW